MSHYHDYESLAWLDFKLYRPVELTEAYSGTAVVGWYGKIERQLVNLLRDAVSGQNYPYSDKIREFLKTWRENQITGSINRETLKSLEAPARQLAVDNWNLSDYFSSLKDQLNILIASEEQLPRGMEEPGNEPLPGGGGGGGGGPPMSPSFGAEDEAPGGAGGAGGEMPGAGGAPGGPGGAPGEEGALEGEPGAEGAPGGEPNPGEEEAPLAEPGAPPPEEDNIEEPEAEDMPGRRFGLA